MLTALTTGTVPVHEKENKAGKHPLNSELPHAYTTQTR